MMWRRGSQTVISGSTP